MNICWRRWLLIAVLLTAVAVASGQQAPAGGEPATARAAGDDVPEEGVAPGEEPGEEPGDDTLGDALMPPAAEDRQAEPLAQDEAEADDQTEAETDAEVTATMERFVPSEQISEDRSVSFPNDI